MSEDKKINTAKKEKTEKTADKSGVKSLYAQKKREERSRKKPFSSALSADKEEFDQQIVDIARVTRVMAGGKRMRFRACVALGNKKGKVAVGLAKGADVSIAVNKAVNNAKKSIIDVPIVNGTIPHEIYQKLGAAKILLKPASKGKGVISGGAARIILELSGIKNITSKSLGTSNKVNVAKCTLKALENIKKVEFKKEKLPNESKAAVQAKNEDKAGK